MSGRKSRSKGQRGEREVRDLFRSAGYWSERGRSQSAGGGELDPDVRHSMPDVHVEVKFQQAVPDFPYKAIDQAKSDAPSHKSAVFMRKNHKPWLVVMLVNHQPVNASCSPAPCLGVGVVCGRVCRVCGMCVLRCMFV